MKTIFISISRGVLIRNILRTDVLKTLLEQPDVKVVILSAREIKDYFREEFTHPKISLEYAPAKGYSKFRKFFIILFSGLVYTVSERRKLRYGSGEKPGDPRIIYYIKHITFSILSKFKFLKYIARWVEESIFIDKDYDYLFIKYKPDLVFCSSIYSNLDIILAKAAKRFGVKSICMPKSWDTIGRLFFRARTDKIILNNVSMKSWLVKEQLIPEKDMYVSGLPQFDIYKQKTVYMTRDEYCKATGLDPEKPIILFATEDQLISWSEDYVKELIEGQNILDKYNLIVRPHFTAVSQKKYDVFKHHKNLYIDDEHLRISYMFGDGWDATKDNMDWLAETINVADVVVAFMSTFVLDSMVFDKPVINPYYDVESKNSTMPIKEGYKFIHYKMVLDEGAVPLAKNGGEIIDWIEKYLQNPNLLQSERKKTLDKFCYKVDGKSGQRIAKIVLDQLL